MDIQLADPTFVGHLLDLDDRTPVLAPSIVSMPDGRPQNPYLAARPSSRAMRWRRLMLSSPIAVQAALLAGEARSRLRAPDAKSPDAHRCPVYAPHGSIIPLHRRYFAAGGNLVHPVFLFNEEITVAEQCRRLGLTVMFEPSLRVIHEKHQSTRLLRSWRILRAHVDAANYGYRVIAGETA